MFVDTLGSSFVIVQCFVRMCLISGYNLVSSICQIITFLPTCCIFCLTSKLNCFCSTTNICRYNNNSICIVITGIVLIWLLYFGGLTYLLKLAKVLKSNATATTNTTLNSTLSTLDQDQTSGTDQTGGTDPPAMRGGPFPGPNFLQVLSRKDGKGPFFDPDSSYLSELPDHIVDAEAQAQVRDPTWPPVTGTPVHQLRFLHVPQFESKLSETTAADILGYELFDKFQDMMSDLFASTRNYAILPSTTKVHTSTPKSSSVPTFQLTNFILSPNSHRYASKATMPLLTTSFNTTPKTNETETIHRDMFRRYWQQGRFCG